MHRQVKSRAQEFNSGDNKKLILIQKKCYFEMKKIEENASDDKAEWDLQIKKRKLVQCRNSAQILKERFMLEID